jgi:hypothetical protein
LLDEGTRVLRELATQQGLAFSAYGEALQRFGGNEIGWTDLFKTTGDIYVKEVARTVWSLIRADVNVYAWMLSMAGAKVLRPDAEQKQDAAPEPKPARRGRR